MRMARAKSDHPEQVRHQAPSTDRRDDLAARARAPTPPRRARPRRYPVRRSPEPPPAPARGCRRCRGTAAGRPRTRPRTPRSPRCRSPAGSARPRPAALASATAGNASSSSGRELPGVRGGPVDRRRRPPAPGPASPAPSAIGSRMSGGLAWAIVEPSTNSTIEWITDCGCTITSMSSYGTSNSSCASITSSALLTMVAELIVTTGPMSQVGCASACSGVTSRQLVAAPAPERPAAGGEDQPAHLGRACRRAGTGPAPSAPSRPARSAPAASPRP